jgi:4-hydroxybenzoate polyprenyltransferase
MIMSNFLLKRDKINDYINLIRLNRPIPIWLLLLPCLFGIFLNARYVAMDVAMDIDSAVSLFKLIKIVTLFTLGAIIMRSAGVIINDIFDCKIDAKIKRTKNRPLACNKITIKEALILFFILLLCGLVILLQFNQKVIYLGFVSLFVVIIYPLTKRVTYFPQLILAIAYNVGVLMSSLEILNKISAMAMLLYLVSIIWTLIYDTIYAYQDFSDDLANGIGSTAVKFGKQGKKILTFLAFLMFVGFVEIGIFSGFSWVYFLIICIGNFYLATIIKKCDFKNSNDCAAAFKANFWFGLIILSGIIIG